MPNVIKKLTPVLMVDAIEPCLPLWVDRLGWNKTVEVPEGDRLGFVILEKDGAEVMYQTWESVEKDVGSKPVKAVEPKSETPVREPKPRAPKAASKTEEARPKADRSPVVEDINGEWNGPMPSFLSVSAG